MHDCHGVGRHETALMDYDRRCGFWIVFVGDVGGELDARNGDHSRIMEAGLQHANSKTGGHSHKESFHTGLDGPGVRQLPALPIGLGTPALERGHDEG